MGRGVKTRGILFLDIDGVLNSKNYICRRGRRETHPDDDIGPEHVEQLNRIIEETGAEIVISSAWRLMYPLEDLTDILTRCGVKADIIAKTPDSVGGYRGHEITRWLLENRDQCDFVILDDGSDMWPVEHRLVKTEFETGLTPERADTVIRMFERKSS